jgi:hypothetical protein
MKEKDLRRAQKVLMKTAKILGKELKDYSNDDLIFLLFARGVSPKKTAKHMREFAEVFNY